MTAVSAYRYLVSGLGRWEILCLIGPVNSPRDMVKQIFVEAVYLHRDHDDRE